MGTLNVHRPQGEEAEVEARTEATTEAASDDRPAPPEPGEVAERLGEELARLRARFAVDPVTANRSLAPAWNGSAAGLEDDESEFLDAMADCLGAGLSLDTALACWHAGDLAYDPDEGEEAEEPAANAVTAASAPQHHGSGRRLLVR